jgi:hypothetical protein
MLTIEPLRLTTKPAVTCMSISLSFLHSGELEVDPAGGPTEIWADLRAACSTITAAGTDVLRITVQEGREMWGGWGGGGDQSHLSM